MFRRAWWFIIYISSYMSMRLYKYSIYMYIDREHVHAFTPAGLICDEECVIESCPHAQAARTAHAPHIIIYNLYINTKICIYLMI